ncbi:MAG: hypothetical protein L0Z55_09205 [Planctomycetes bacterium]|nr:hypothetical protein [Planctomycetota bacterium]
MILLLQAPMWLPCCVETATSILNDLTSASLGSRMCDETLATRLFPA